MVAIIKKELSVYFKSMTGYVFIGFLVLLSAIYFSFINVLQLSPDYSIVLSGISIAFLILIPALTMRMFAEESRHKTDQLLFTSPVTIGAVVVGKYLAALLMFLIGMAVTVIFPVMISRYGELPAAHIASAFAGYILLGAAFISVGMFVSVLTDNQIIAAVSTFAALFVMYIMAALATGLPTDRTSSVVFVIAVIAALAYAVFNSTRNYFAAIITAAVGACAAAAVYFSNAAIYDGAMVKVFQWFSVMSRFENFSKGVLNLADCVYFITFTAAFVYLTANVIEKRRWR